MMNLIMVGHEEERQSNVDSLSDTSCDGDIQVIWQTTPTEAMPAQIYMRERNRKV
jgi:hypothetical protein